jgi:rubrerythrin
MTQANTLDILKQAILLERRGQGFYSQVARGACDPAVAAFFTSMAEEEAKHIKVLARQYKSYVETSAFAPGDEEGGSGVRAAAAVLDEETRGRISAAGFEAASIEAAMFMEQKAVDLYAGRALAATDPEERKLYAWLASWEREHLAMLSDINKSLVESVWYDNQFWPF